MITVNLKKILDLQENYKDDTKMTQTQNYELVQYKIDSNRTLDVTQIKDDIWLTQKQMAQLFDVDKSVITKHIKNIYESGELNKSLTCIAGAKNALFDEQGISAAKNYLTVNYYNLDLILSVGYRVNSKRGTQFRQWATKVIKDRIKQEYSKQQALNKADVEKILTLKKECAKLINRALRANGFSQAQISKELGLSSKTVANSINGIHYNNQVFQWIEDNIFPNYEKSSLLEKLKSTYKFSDNEMALLEVFFIGGRFLREEIFVQIYNTLKYDSFDEI